MIINLNICWFWNRSLSKRFFTGIGLFYAVHSNDLMTLSEFDYNTLKFASVHIMYSLLQHYLRLFSVYTVSVHFYTKYCHHIT